MAYFGAGKGPIHLDNVRCMGAEVSLGECPAEGEDAHDCKHSEDAGVICDYVPEPVGDGAIITQTCGMRPNTQRRRRRIIGGDKSIRYTVNTRTYKGLYYFVSLHRYCICKHIAQVK
jgi:serine protease 12 (motopsin)